MKQFELSQSDLDGNAGAKKFSAGRVIRVAGQVAQESGVGRQGSSAWVVFGKCRMDEGRKRTILTDASILGARKLEGKPSSALEAAISDAISLAEKIMQRNRRTLEQAAPTARSVDDFGGGLPLEESELGPILAREASPESRR